MGLRHRMLKLPLVLAFLVVGQNHAKLSSISKQKLMAYRTMLEAAEKAGLGDAFEAGCNQLPCNPNNPECCPTAPTTTEGWPTITHFGPAAEGTAPPDLDKTAGDSTKVDFPSDAGNAGNDNAATAAEATSPPDLDNNAGESTKTDQKQLAQLIKSIFGQLSSGNPVKMIVDIKNPEVMIGNNEVNGIVEQPELEIKQQEAGVQAGKGPSLGLELGKQVGSMQAPAPATVQAMSSASLKKPNSRSVIYHGQDTTALD